MKKFISKNKEQIVVFIISIIAFIVGFKAVGLVKSLIIIGIADLLYIFSILTKTKSKKSNIKSNQMKENNVKTNKKKKKIKIIKILIILFLLGFIFVMIAASMFWMHIVNSAPEFDPQNLYRAEASILYYADGEIMAKLGTEKREKITYNEIAEVLVNAIVATEDSRFFQHNGFDLPRFLVASVKQVLGQGGGGASTLTMQVAKNNFTDTIQTITRKFTDIYLSIFQIEKNYTKQEIIEFYVNAPYLGSGAYGVEQACQTYFGKSAKDINLAEAALIAGLFQLPSTYDPNINPEYAESRRQTVLYLMKRHGYITDEEYQIALKMTVDKLLVSKKSSTNSDGVQAAIDTVVQEVINDTKSPENPNGLNPYNVPMEIYTTIDKNKQEYITSIMNGETFNWENDFVDAGISVLDIKTGAMVAVGAGRHRSGQLQYNTATMLNKQIGSTAKPLYDYAVGIEYENWSTYTPFIDEEYAYSDGTKINNWDRKFNGFMSLRTALAQSRNIPALKAFKLNKNSNIKNFVLSLGLDPELEGGIVHEAHSIGGYTGESPLTMSAAYAAFGNGGYYIEPHSYTKIVYRDTNETIEKKVAKTRVMSEETAYMMTSLLQSSAQYGLGNQYNIGGAIYGAKTGTTNYDAKIKEIWKFGTDAVNDLWVNGVSPDYAISVWYGYQERNAENAAYTSTSYTISHRRLFQAVAKGIFIKGSNWTKPSGVIEVEIENETYPAKLPSAYTPADKKITELFKKGTEPTEVSDRYDTLADVTNLKGTIKDNKLTLTWTEVKPNAINEEWIDNYLNSLYTHEETKAAAKTNLLNYNASTFGNLVYKIYSKDGEELTLIGSTDKTTFDIKVTSSSPTTYVVKTAYEKFAANISKGASVNVKLDNVEDEITATLNGEEKINITKGSTYADKSVTVKEGTKDITKNLTSSELKVTIKDSKGNTVKSIDTSKIETYTITYSINYKKFTKTLTRTVKVLDIEKTQS